MSSLKLLWAMSALFKICALIIFFGASECRSAESEIIDIDWCDAESRREAPKELVDTIEKPVYYKDQDGAAVACYFQVKDANEKANKGKIGDNYVFSFYIARSICGKFSATLPTIRDKDENAFVSKLPGTESLIALGAELMWDGFLNEKYDIRFSKWRIQNWDDWVQGLNVDGMANDGGQTRSLSDSNMVNPDDDALGLILAVHEYKIYWNVVSRSGGASSKVKIFCKQNLTRFKSSHYRGSTSPRSITPIDNINWCDDESRSNAPPELADMIVTPIYYRDPSFSYERSACYFQLKNATKKANANRIRTENSVSYKLPDYYLFSYEYARETCGKFSATLPTIRDQNEHKFVARGIPINQYTIALGAQLSYNGETLDDKKLIRWSNWRIKYWDDQVPGFDYPLNKLITPAASTSPEHDALGLFLLANYPEYPGVFVLSKSSGTSKLVALMCKQNLTKFYSLSKTTNLQKAYSTSMNTKTTNVSHPPSHTSSVTEDKAIEQGTTSGCISSTYFRKINQFLKFFAIGTIAFKYISFDY